MPLRGETNTFTSNSAPPFARPRHAARSIRHPAQHLLVRALDVAQVAPEAVLVELFERGLVPEAAGIGTDFVAQQDLAVMTSEFELEIHQDHAALIEEPAQDVVNLERHRMDCVELALRGPSEQDRMDR